MSSYSPFPTLQSTIQEYTGPDKFVSTDLHPFASSSQVTTASLRELLNTTTQLSHSLNLHLNQPFSNPKLVSLLRQNAQISNTLLLSDLNIKHTVASLRKRTGINYIEDIPLDASSMVEWCIAKVESWGTSAGMESFKEEERDGRMTVVLGGKVLVVDIEMAVDRSDPRKPKIDVGSAKTSYAVPSGSSGATTNTDGSTSLDGFLASSIRAFFVEVQKDEEMQDCLEAARLGKVVADSLEYLMTLDKLASKEGDGGLRWFSHIDKLASTIEPFAKSEAEAISSNLALTQTPLDIFLLRSHCLPLPFLTSPSMSFLTYISPVHYLTLLRTSKAIPNSTPISNSSPHLPQLDISFPRVRSYISAHPRPRGITIATLHLSEEADQFHASPMGMPSLSSRPSFHLASPSPSTEQGFLQPTFQNPADPGQDILMQDGDAPEATFSGKFKWILDFTEGGKYPGVVVSQSRMREIEIIVNPLSGVDHLPGVAMMSHGGANWVDLLLSPMNPGIPQKYTAVYTSPTGLHPPLQLRLTCPEEPGFLLEKVQVQGLKEVWGILEVIKEQCWLNETLLCGAWTPEGIFHVTDTREPEADEDASDEDLQNLLSGNTAPQKIPVNVYIFDSNSLESMTIPPRRPKLVMTCPERPPISGLVEISVSYDTEKERGVSVSINGAMETEFKLDVLEEVCRRGGTLGLAGRIWAIAHRSL
ncbi:hypothetical protein JAAARDRAFT_35389 [Jaapia argillacea MUCL 33604]|uniref:Mediator complex subunit 1 n=1 Tax=Jaapia argillacea MUCL 33604 TaxID=933084 RepID=A0A067PSI5_9AGAM|nr:hypothetical protein JAAARDRAFT_35389 [Jaapia argillacea MUCL 33604]